ncbi:MAG: Ig-like domain-containing protein [Clostridiales Family XIII bacterium]|jgi:uncharacterized repeat protein (TIGR02543 family)|nr:Ig-like domain-containing protein [Clostridiales Family XIII bacterium]
MNMNWGITKKQRRFISGALAAIVAICLLTAAQEPVYAANIEAGPAAPTGTKLPANAVTSGRTQQEVINIYQAVSSGSSGFSASDTFQIAPILTTDTFHPGVLKDSTISTVMAQINGYRQLAGLTSDLIPYSEKMEYGQLGAAGMQIVRSLTHSFTDAQQTTLLSYMTQEQLDKAKAGIASGNTDPIYRLWNGNCSSGNNIVQSVRGYIDDTRNVNSGVGHRLNMFTRLGKAAVMGIGSDRGYSTVSVYGFAQDQNSAAYYAWPTEGFFPRQAIDDAALWSVQFSRDYKDTALEQMAVSISYNGQVYSPVIEKVERNDNLICPNICFILPDELKAAIASNSAAYDNAGIAELTVTVTGLKNGSGADFYAEYTTKLFKELPVPLESISLSKNSATMVAGESSGSEQLSVAYTPTNTTDDRTVTWSSDNEAVATVANGLVTAKSPGTATITAKVGTKTASFACTVRKAVSMLTVEISPQEYSGSKLTPVAIVKDGSTVLEQGTDYSVSYGGNVSAGTGSGTITITGNGHYVGTKSATFDILRKAITVDKGTYAITKAYDGTSGATTAEVSGRLNISGAVGNDEVSVNATPGDFSSASVSSGLNVRLGLSITGGDAGNYALAQNYIDIDSASITKATRSGIITPHQINKNPGSEGTAEVDLQAVLPPAPLGDYGAKTFSAQIEDDTDNILNGAPSIVGTKLQIPYSGIDAESNATAAISVTVDSENYNSFSMPVVLRISEATNPVYWNVDFDTDGGSPVPQMLVENGSSIGALPATVKTGYSFDGWFASREGGAKMTDSYTVISDLTLYAHWSRIHDDNWSLTPDDTPNKVTGTPISALSDIFIAPAGTAKLPAAVDFGGGFASNVTWSSADASIAQIGADAGLVAVGEGVVTLVAKSVSDPTRQATITVTVAKPVTKVRTPLATLYAKKGTKISPPVAADSVSASGAADISAKLSWATSNPNVAAVDATGKITARKAGTAFITAEALNGKSLRIKIVVVNKAKKISGISLSKAPNKIAVGKSAELRVKISPAKSTNAIVKFKSNNPRVLSVDKAGKITAIKKGKAKITVSVGSKKYTKSIAVK